MWSLLLTFAKSIVTSWIDKKNKTQERELQLVDKQYDYKEALLNSQTQGNLDEQSIVNNRFSWADEVFKAVILIPFILVFFPQTANQVKTGYIIIDNDMPVWIIAIIILMSIDQFGMRGMIVNSSDKIKDFFFNIKNKKI